MTQIEKDSINRRIAEWLEPISTGRALWNYVEGHYYSHFYAWESHAVEGVDIGEFQRIDWQPRDFFLDESANAQLRRKARLQLMLGHRYIKGVLQDDNEYWFCGPPNEISARALDIKVLAHDLDDKTAVVLAFVKFMESGGRK